MDIIPGPMQTYQIYLKKRKGDYFKILNIHEH